MQQYDYDYTSDKYENGFNLKCMKINRNTYFLKSNKKKKKRQLTCKNVGLI